MASKSLVPDRIGQIIGNRYQVLGTLGEGGQSSVYRARDLRDGDEVALKILKAGADAASTERMFREAQALATLQGTAALRVLDQQWAADGAMCLVTELLQGRALDEELDLVERQGQRMSAARVVAVLDPVVTTLQSAHSLGIVHRDLKPANVFVIAEERGGGVRLLDFGFAKFQRMRGLTMDGMVAGSPSYIAPETWKGQRDVSDHRVDVYGIAAVIFRCLSGTTPFTSRDLADLLREVTTAPRPSLHALRPDLPPAIDDWVQQSLAIDPEQRFQQITALWRAFRHVVGT